MLRQEIAKSGGHDMSAFEKPYPIPIAPHLLAKGAIKDKCSVFVSAMAPLLMTFTVENKDGGAQEKNKTYPIMYKNGDDVRQDQLVLQLIAYMDELLKQVNQDLKFTAYKTLAHSVDDGMLEFVPGCKTI